MIKYIKRFVNIFNMKIISNIIGKVNLLIKLLTKIKSKKYIKIIYKLNIFDLLIEIFLNI